MLKAKVYVTGHDVPDFLFKFAFPPRVDDYLVYKRKTYSIVAIIHRGKGKFEVEVH